MPERDLRAEERHYSRIIEKNPGDSSAYVDRANVYLDLGLRARAFADYSRAIDLDPDCRIAYFNRGNLNLEEGRFQRAIDDYSSVLARDPEDAQAYSNRAVAFEGLERWREALADYDHALRLAPHLVLPRMNRGNALFGLGSYEEAIAAYSDAIMHAPRGGSIYLRRAGAHFQKGDYEAALADLDQARAFGCITAQSEVDRGHIYQLLRQPENAVVALTEAIALDPTNAFAYGLCGWNQLKLGRIDQARSSLLKCLELEPDDAKAHFSMGVLLEMQGEFHEAREHFDRAAALERGSASGGSPPAGRGEARGGPPHKRGHHLDGDQLLVARDTGEVAPFQRFDGWLKSIRREDLDDEQARALALIFGGFYEEQRTHESVKAMSRAFLGDAATGPGEAAFAFRRYAGGKDLPASRYYSVCMGSSGNDGGTLRNELCAYVDLNRCGDIQVMDFTDPTLLGPKLAHRSRFSDREFPEHAIGVSFSPQRGIRSAVYAELRDTERAKRGARIHLGEGFTIFFPFRVERISIERVIDLRHPEVQRWLAERVFSGIPTACYIYGEGVTGHEGMPDLTVALLRQAKRSLFLDHEEVVSAAQSRPNDGAAVLDLKRGRDGLKFYAASPEGVHNRFRGLSGRSFLDLLPLLIHHPRGGSPITDAIGSWLREIGVNALIYPSARCDISVHIEDGSITQFAGWNLLDYRDAPSAPRLLRVIQHPESYISPRVQLRRAIADVPRLQGSFQIGGISKRESIGWAYGVELFVQQHVCAGVDPVHREDFVIGEFGDYKQRVSMAQLRAMVRAGMADLSTVIKKEGAPSEESGAVGQWISDFLSTRVKDRTTSGGGVRYGDEWFFYRLDPQCELQIICPLCEYERTWYLDRAEAVEERCPQCGYPGASALEPEPVRQRLLELCRTAS